MAPWLASVVKLLPHAATIVSTAAPLFTKRNATPGQDEAALVKQQIAELQAAVSRADEQLRSLDSQLRGTVAAIEQAAVALEARLARLRYICVGCAFASAAALVAALLALARH